MRQISTFNEVWATSEGGPDNLGATFFEPTDLPEGYSMLGCYCQPNNRPLNGWVLVGKDEEEEALAKPVDYTLVWSTDSLKPKQSNESAYIWLPTPPEGYNPVGMVVTTSNTKPSLGKIRCVRSDFTHQCEVDAWIWGTGKHGFNVYGLRPEIRGTRAPFVSVGTFIGLNGGHKQGSPLSVCCLKNKKSEFASAMPNLAQINLLIKTYSPMLFFHPDEIYLPSSVTWFFTHKTMLYRKGGKSKPVLIESDGVNLPQCVVSQDQDEYWINLPSKKEAKEKVKKGDLESAEAYFHIKPMHGATFTDIAMWVFYPFNGPSMAKFAGMNVSLGRIGEHVGDWEHITMRVSNFTGELWSVYFSQHDEGMWLNASELEFISDNGNNFAAYSSLKSHASYPKPGLFLQGSRGMMVGLRDDAAKGGAVLETGAHSKVVAVEHLCSLSSPPWVDYLQQWGPTVSYKMQEEEMMIIMKFLPWPVRVAFKLLLKLLPYQAFGEKGPLGPKAKSNWIGDEA